jgi:NADH-quinone oxidoreductase subunit L
MWLIPALPLAGFVFLAFAGRRMGEPVAGWVATAMVAASFVVAVVVFIGLVGLDDRVVVQTLFSWIPAGSFSVDIGLYLDPLSAVMLLFITGVSTLIHLYSIGYMHGDENFSKFFVYLNLFVFSMVVLVLGDNLLLTFLGWEGVGACSYLLISFWFSKPANATAGKKAFVTNRIGDWGFLVGIFVVFFTFGSLNYSDILPAAGGLAQTTATFIAVMLFIGAIGKSAQLPLSIWLPDAMAGPTPVSALIHAATMVTAGVYLLSRIHPIIDVSASWVPMLIAWTGAITALLAATVALAQTDIKKVLAYSTVEMLGYMFLAVGIGAYWAAIFLMIMHAFFKALLFLCAGSVIHGMHENQDMRVMGGLRVLMPVTFVAYIAGWLSLAGVPPFSGFWAKDEILAYAWQQNKGLWVVGIVTAFLTAVYIGRQFFMVFTGRSRWPEFVAAIANDGTTVGDDDTTDATADAATGGDLGDADTPAVDEAAIAGAASVALVTGAGVSATANEVDFHPLPEGFTPHESPWTMTVPLVFLAVLAAVGGAISLPFVPGQFQFLYDWLKPVFAGSATTLELSDATVYALLGFSSLVALAGTGVAVWVWYLGRGNAARLAPSLLRNAWYYDDAVASVVGGPGTEGFSAVATFDSNVVDGAVGGVGSGASRIGQALRHTQDGNVRRYALAIGVGSVLALAFMLTRVVA